MTQITATYIDHMGSDLSVVNAARVSFGKKSYGESIEYDLFHDDPDAIKASVVKYKAEGWVITSDVDDWKLTITKPTMGDTKLIKYLAKHRHTSPFGHAFASFHCTGPLFVHAQLVKHKFLRTNTISRRYTTENIEFYVPDVWRGKSDDKKQGSEGIVDVGDWGDANWAALKAYNDLLEHGVAPEMARMVLPQSLMTEWIWSGSVDAFADMCRLRCATDTQAETRLVADDISKKMSELFPVSWAALMNNS